MANLNSNSGVVAPSTDLHASDPQQASPQLNIPVQPPGSTAALFSQPTQTPTLDEAVSRDVALQQAGQQYAPNATNNSSIFSALGALGNIAGAATGRGDIGSAGTQIAESMRQEAINQQQQFYRRVRDEEQNVRQEQAAKQAVLQEKLLGDSLKPLLRGMKPDDQAVMLQLINSGKSGVARQAIYQQQQQNLNNQVRNTELDMKKQAFGVSQTKALQDVYKNNLDIQDKTADSFAGYTPAKQKEELKKQSDTFQTRIKPFADVTNSVAQVDQLLGGTSSEQALDKLSRVSGFLGGARGSYSAFGTPEDKALYTAINNLVTDISHQKFGSALTATEEAGLTAALGRSPKETTLGNALRDPRAFLSTLDRLKDLSRDKLSSAESGLDPAVLTRFTEQGGRPTSSLQSFEAHLQANKQLGGVALGLDTLPPALKDRPNGQSEWLSMTPIQKKQFMIQLRQLAQ